MIDPWRFEHQICGCGSEWCWSEVSKKLFVFIVGMFRRRTWVFFRWLSCSIKDIMAFQGWICLWSQSHPPLYTCVFFEFPSRLPSMMSWVIGMNDAVSCFYIPNPAEPN